MNKIIEFFKKDAVRLILGAVLFVAALVTDKLAFGAISVILYVSALIVSGIFVYIDAVKGILRGDLLDEKFLMSIASVGAMIVGEMSEGVAVMLFFLLGEMFEHMAVRRSRGKIRALMDICPDEATVIREGEEITVDADEVSIGDILIVRSGERIPVDMKIIDGTADIDTSAMTGESVPRAVGKGDEVDGGSVVIGGVLRCEATKTAETSGAQRILQMVENASDRKSREESFITAFSRVYTPIVVALAVLIAVIPPIFGLMSIGDSVYRALIFLVISCPCALVISVPMAFFGGIGCAASRGILFKGGNSFSPVANTKTVAFDKTGTLTSGEFSISKTVSAELPEAELLKIAASIEYASRHPIALCFAPFFDESVTANNIKELPGRGTVGEVKGKKVAVGNGALMHTLGISVPEELEKSLDNTVFCAYDGKLAGAFVISDTVREEAKSAVEELKRLGVLETYVLSGDKRGRAEEIGAKIGIDTVYAELLPEQKFAKLEELIAADNGKVMYVGDGINDAPALALADVGVAMGGIGSDSAIESADLVIVSDNLARIPEAVRIARKTLAIAKENIIFALGVKLAVMLLGAFGIANMWLAVFADVGVSVLAILNSMRTLLYARRDKK
ncbi:MAG: cadmium-translocating P-type ATPase [Clostridia bacterium]|nr:cadmium-translocating P-type ATPase [Clostridia bacterium]